MHSALQSENVQFGDEVALFALRAKTNVCVERLRRGLLIEEISEQTYRVRTRAVRYFLSCMEFRTRTYKGLDLSQAGPLQRLNSNRSFSYVGLEFTDAS